MVNNAPSVYKSPSVYKTAGGGGGLPPQYTKLLYVRNKGNAWVKIDKAINGLGVDAVIALNSYSSNNSVGFLANRGSSNDVLYISDTKNFSWNNASYSGSQQLNASLYEQIFIKGRANGTNTVNVTVGYGVNTYSFSVAAATYNRGNYIVLLRETDNPFADSKRLDFYSSKIYDRTNELMLDLVPCKNSSNEYGVFDFVDNLFYKFESQGDIIPGPEI